MRVKLWVDDEFHQYVKKMSESLTSALGKKISIQDTTVILKMCMESRGPITIFIDGKRSRKRAGIQNIDVGEELSLR